ncbi:hypothetical protein [Raoultella terrigena]|uniref:hypothetical protein n=1 Tax=Raoultella terrigena TaxID=577 RepID=UPI0009779BBF|nr:hypothetical protein [Raoultella terrigena]OMP96502.1 hypothetical protein BZP36_01430 [Raoultella terrigena]
MSVPSQTPYNIYTANGLTTVFAYKFMIMTAGDLDVSVNGTSIASGFNVQGAGQTGGGQVVFTEPPANGAIVTLLRKLAIKRDTDYQDNGDLLAETINADFDRLWLAMQQAFLSDSLSLKRPLLGGPYNAGGLKIISLQDPTNPQDAATKGWVDRQYSVPTSEAKQAAAEAKEARDESREIADKFGDVDGAITAAESARDVALDAADSASGDANRAENAANAASAAAASVGNFSSIAEGLANTSSGQTFGVFQSLNGYAVIRYYLNSAGTAVYKGVLLGNEAVETVSALAPLADSKTFLDADEFDTDFEYPILDSTRQILAYWTGATLHLPAADIKKLVLDGYEIQTEISLSGDEYDDDMRYARLDSNRRILELISGEEYLTAAMQMDNRSYLIKLSSGEYDIDFPYIMVDSNRRVIIAKSDEGKIIGGISVDDSGNNIVSYSTDDAYSESGISYGSLDSNYRVLYAVYNDGSFYPKTSGGDDGGGDVNFIGEAVLDGEDLLESDAETGDIRVLAISSTISDVINRVPDGYFEFKDTAETDVIGNLLYSRYGNYDPHAKFGRRAFAFYGHSFLGNNQVLSRELHNHTGLPVYNFARSGATSRSIALRNDAYRLKYTPVGGSVPASGSVDFVEHDSGPLGIVGDAAIADQLQVSYAGVLGYVMWDGSKMTFTRNASGSAVPVTDAQELIVLPYTSVVTNSVPVGTYYNGAHEAIYLLWLGRNNISSLTQIISDLNAIAQRMRSLHRRFILCPEFTQTTETIGTSGYNAVYAVNAMYKSLYPENYCEIDGLDLLQNFRNHYNPSDPDDVAAYNAGTVPPSLINTGDTLHPNSAGIIINEAFIYQFANLKGWA